MERGLPSPLDLWAKQRGERSAPSFTTGVKGARPSFSARFVGRASFTSRFVAKTEGRKDRGLP